MSKYVKEHLIVTFPVTIGYDAAQPGAREHVIDQIKYFQGLSGASVTLGCYDVKTGEENKNVRSQAVKPLAVLRDYRKLKRG